MPKDLTSVIEENFSCPDAYWDSNNRYYTLNPLREDHHVGSFWITKTGFWTDRATKDGGLLTKTDEGWKLDRKTAEYIFEFKDEEGNVLYSVIRREYQYAPKQIRPFYINGEGKKIYTIPKRFRKNRPLYNLDKLTTWEGPVVIVEGEKCCHERIQNKIPNCLLTTWSGGAGAVNRVDLKPLQGKEIILWPDNDEAGKEAMKYIASKIPGTKMVQTDALEPKWDIVDVYNAKIDIQTVLNTAQEITVRPGDVKIDNLEVPDEKDLASVCYEIISENLIKTYYYDYKAIVMFRGRGGKTIASYTSSQVFRRWVVNLCHTTLGKVVAAETIKQAILLLESYVELNGEEREPFFRIGGGRGAVYIYLADEENRCVKVTPEGWEIVDYESAELLFLRSPSMEAMAYPDKKGDISLLRKYINLEDDSAWYLLVSFLVASLMPGGPYPGLQITGEQGSAKSTFSRIIKALLDPSKAPVRSQPRNIEDAAIAAVNSHLLVFDNVSTIQAWFSDLLCTFSTGGGVSKRRLYSDSDELYLSYQKPVILNGITDFINRSDLQDRYIHLDLPAIINGSRKLEGELWADFDRDLPKIFGGLLNLMTGVLKLLPDITLDHYPRMADFAKLGEAVNQIMGWESGAFVKAYYAYLEEANMEGLETSIVGGAMLYFLGETEDHTTLLEAEELRFTASELLKKLNIVIRSDATKRNKHWPGTPRKLSNDLKRISPALRSLGYIVERKRTSHERYIVIKRKDERPVKYVGFEEAIEL